MTHGRGSDQNFLVTARLTMSLVNGWAILSWLDVLVLKGWNGKESDVVPDKISRIGGKVGLSEAAESALRGFSVKDSKDIEPVSAF